MSDICELGQTLTIAAGEIYASVLHKFGKKVAEKFLQGATQDEIDSFTARLKDSQAKALHERITLIVNRILTDHNYLKEHGDMLEDRKSLAQMREVNEIAKNQLQSIENETSILQRDIDFALDKLEKVSEDILMQM